MSPRRPILQIFCDGSCPVNPGPGGWAYAVLLEQFDQTNIYESGYELSATNNTMELTAGIKAMQRVLKLNLQRKYMVHVWSDSNYVVQGMQNWRHIWAMTNFENEPHKNRKLWKEAHDIAQQIPVIRFRWLKGHAGHYWNEYCDRMAAAAVKHGNRTQEA